MSPSPNTSGNAGSSGNPLSLASAAATVLHPYRQNVVSSYYKCEPTRSAQRGRGDARTHHRAIFGAARGLLLAVGLPASSSGSLAKFTAMRRASSRVSRLVAEQRRGAPRCPQMGDKWKSVAHARNDLFDPTETNAVA